MKTLEARGKSRVAGLLADLQQADQVTESARACSYFFS